MDQHAAKPMEILPARAPARADGAPQPYPAMPPLPTPLTSLIGREPLIETVVTMLADPRHRLVTLTGPGGVGKSRVGVQVAETARSHFPGGTGFIGLASILDANLVLPAIATALAIHEGDRRFLVHRLAAHLDGPRCLLVLDNAEQVVDAGPDLVALLAACPSLSLLVTSRTPLRVSGEHVYPVPPLDLPEEGNDPAAHQAEAVRLFVARAQAMRPDTPVDSDATAAVAEICRRLDGLPLAIELAAARSRLMAPPAMLSRLDHRLPLLTGGHRDQPERLRTMRDAIAWSYDLLSPESQTLFRWLSVFVGGFTLEGAQAVTGADPQTLLEAVETLVDHNLVQPMLDTTAQPHYAMLQTIREYGLDQLAAAGEARRARDRHATHYLALAERIDARLDKDETRLWLPQLDFELPDFRSAFTWLVREGRPEQALRLACALWRYWRIRGYLTEGRDLLQRALDLPGAVAPAVRADGLWKLGYLHFYLGELDQGRALLEQGAAQFTAAGEARGMATALDALGSLLRLQRDLDGAEVAHRRALDLWEKLDDRFEHAMTLANIGMLALDRGELDSARALLNESLGVAEALGSQREIGNRYFNLARVELAAGEPALARGLLERALEIFDDLGDQIATAMAVEILGQALHRLGDPSRATAHLVRSLELRRQLNFYRNLADGIERLAAAAVSLAPDVAARLLGAAHAHRTDTGIERLGIDAATWDDTLAAARAALGPAHFDAAWREGASATLEAAGQAAEQALAHLPAPEAASPSPLSPRELEILRLVAAGHSNGEIAELLYISRATVKRHVTNILARLELPSRAAAIAWAVQAGLLDE